MSGRNKVGWCTAVVLLLLGMGGFTAAAQESGQIFLEQQWQASGMEELYACLPPETAGWMERLGIDAFSWDALLTMDAQTVWSALADVVVASGQAPWQAAWWMLGGVIMLGVYGVLCEHGAASSLTMRTVGVLAVLTPMLVPLWQTMERTQAAADSASVFSLSFAPVYAGVLTAQGHTALAVSYQTVMLAAAQAGSLLIGTVVLPLLSVSLALGVAGGLNPEHRLKDVAGGLNKTALFLIGLSMTVFVAVLSFQGVVAATADSVGGRVMRFSVAGFVPVVGGSLSEALYTVRGCLSTLRGTVGGCGVLAMLLILLPTWAECVIWSWLLFLVKTAAAMLGYGDVEAVVNTVQGVVKTLIGILSASALFMIVSLTVMTMTGGGVR